MANYLKARINWAKILSRGGSRPAPTIEEFIIPEGFEFCHKDKVHIFVRGLADGKLHAAKNRNYSDLGFIRNKDSKFFVQFVGRGWCSRGFAINPYVIFSSL